MPTFEHGDTVPLKPAGAETPDILGRGNHSILGFIAVLDESARDILRTAIMAAPQNADHFRLVQQTAGTAPGIYAWNTADDSWFLISDGQVETTAPVTYIVRDSDGDDSDDGLTEGTAFKTLQAAADKIPFHIRDAVIIRAGEHGGTGYTMPLFGAHECEAYVWVFGDGAGTGDGFTETLASTASIAGTDKSKVVTAGGHTIDEFKGHTLIFTSGACDTYRRTVISNTATDILFVTDTDQTGNVPLSGDTFRIVRPSVVINLQAGSTGNADTVATGTSKGFPQRSADAGGGGLILAQLRMVTEGKALAFRNTSVAWLGVEHENTGGGRADLQYAANVCYYGCSNNIARYTAPPVQDLGAVDEAAWTGYGLYRVDTGTRGKGGPFQKLDGPMSTIRGFVVCAKEVETRCNVHIQGGRFEGGLDCRVVGTKVQISGTFWTTNEISIVVSGTARCIRARDALTVQLSAVALESQDGALLEADRHAFIRETACTGGPTGTGLAAKAFAGGQIHHNVAPLFTGMFEVPGVGQVAAAFFTGEGVGIADTNGSSIGRDE